MAGDAIALARSIVEVLDNPLHAGALAECAYRRYLGHFTVETMHDQVAEAYAHAVRLAAIRHGR